MKEYSLLVPKLPGRRGIGIVFVLGLLALLPCFQGCAGRDSRQGHAKGLDWKEVRIDDKFQDVLLRHPVLMVGGADVVDLVSGGRYLIAVGATENKAKDTSAARDRLETIRVAQVRANQELARFAQVHIEGELRVWESQQISSETEMQVQSDYRVEESIVERSEGLVRRRVSIGTWYSADGELFYYAVALPISPQ